MIFISGMSGRIGLADSVALARNAPSLRWAVPLVEDAEPGASLALTVGSSFAELCSCATAGCNAAATTMNDAAVRADRVAKSLRFAKSLDMRLLHVCSRRSVRCRFWRTTV